MTPQSPKAMTPEERAKEINKWMISEMGLENLTDSNLQSYLAEQIKLAQEEARAEGMKKGWQIPEGIRMAGYNKGFSDGQVAMREDCASLVESSIVPDLNWIASAVRGLHPHAPGEGK